MSNFYAEPQRLRGRLATALKAFYHHLFLPYNNIFLAISFIALAFAGVLLAYHKVLIPLAEWWSNRATTPAVRVVVSPTPSVSAQNRATPAVRKVKTEPSPTIRKEHNEQPLPLPPERQPVVVIAPAPTQAPPPQIDCDRVIRSLAAGEMVAVPAECERAYQIFRNERQDQRRIADDNRRRDAQEADQNRREQRQEQIRKAQERDKLINLGKEIYRGTRRRP